MKTKKQLFIALFMVLMWSEAAVAQQTNKLLTFEDAMQLMHEQNPALQRAREQIKEKEFEKQAKRGLYMPQVSLSAQAVAMSDKLHLDLTPISEAITPLYETLGTYGVFSGVANPDPNTNSIMPTLPDEMSTAAVREQLLDAGELVAEGEWDKLIQAKNFASLTADFVWPIFTGGKIKGANEAAEVYVEISREELRQTEGALLSELATRYYGLALAEQVLKVRQQMLESMDKHYTDAQKLFDNGMIAKVELLHAKVSRNEAERELKQAQRNIEIIHAGLAATLFTDSTKIVPVSHLFINKNLPLLSYWVAMANAENPQLKQIEGKRDLVKIKHEVEKGSYLPTIAALGTYNLAEKDLSPYMPDWMVGVGLKWNVFEGMGRRNKIKAGETLSSQVHFAEQKAHADLEAYLTKIYQELSMQMEQKEELEGTLKLAQEYCNSTEKAFSEGFATSSSVVDANTKVAQVKALRLKVLYDYDVALAKFMQTAGIPEQYTSYCQGKNTITEIIE